MRVRIHGSVLLLALAAGCGPLSPPPPAAVRLVDLYDGAAVERSAAAPARAIPRTEWRFDGPAPSTASRRASATRGWEAGPGVSGLAIRGGRLAGASTTDFPLLHLERTEGLDDGDLLHAVEVRLRVSAGANLAVDTSSEEKVDLGEIAKEGRDFPWLDSTPIVAGEQVRGYTIKARRPPRGSELRHLFLRPTDAAGAAFEIESVRLIFRREHLASIPSGVGWHGLSEIYRETIVSRAPETIRMNLTLPPRAWLDLGLGTIENGPVTFRVAAGPGPPLLERTLTSPHRWESARIDLSALEGREAVVSLSLASEQPGALGFWGSPVVRSASAGPRGGVGPPRGVILIWADTLRWDHLDMYGYGRETAPVLRRLAGEGTLFQDCVVQATWTKVSTPSLLTSLYPTSHTVRDFADRLPASAVSIAEVYRDAGHATLSMSSILFTGAFSNVHQGFEELHEDRSLSDRRSSKTAREYVDRLLPWLEAHRDVPFFVFLHVSDPHDPYKPYPPYDTLWADASAAEEHERQAREVRKFIRDPLMKAFGMPTREELLEAGIDPQAYVAHSRDWYDGSIRAMDAEIGRLVERLRELGLERETLLVFTSDHGEEFLEHGRTFHGQSVYGELTRMPLLFWRPGSVPAGAVVEETVEAVDLMPTLLEMSGLKAPAGIQGESLAPLIARAEAGGPGSGSASAAADGRPRARAAFSEKAATPEVSGGAPPPHRTESFAIVLDGWKLIHNTRRAAGAPQYELYDARRDLLDRHDVAPLHPEIVERLAGELEAWRAAALASRLSPDADAARSMSAEELERLRSLGYIQ